MGLESIVNVQISRQTQGISRAGFGLGCVFGPNGLQTGTKKYSSLAAMVGDYTTSDAEYLAAAKYFSQAPHPTSIYARKTSTVVAQVDTITPDVTTQAITTYTVTIDGVDYAFTSDITPTAAEVVTGLKALINADSACAAAATGTTTVILTAKTTGIGFSTEVGSLLALVHTTANVGIASDILAAIQESNAWYLVLLTTNTESTIKEAAKTVEGTRRLMLVRSNDANVKGSSTTDLASLLQDSNYFRSSVWYTGTLVDYLDAGVSGRCLPLDPGSETWAFKTVAGVTVDSLTDTEQSNLEGKNANYYHSIASKSVTRVGKTAGGEFIDIIRMIDSLQADMEERIFQAITSVDKIPYTDAGIAAIENQMRAALQAKVNTGALESFTITVPSAASISALDKADRILTGLSFTAVAAGAVHAVNISGVVTL